MPAMVSNPPGHHHVDQAPPDSPESPIGSTGSLCRSTFTHLTYSRHHLIDVAKETIKISENGHYTNSKGQVVYIKDALDNAVENCAHYEHEFDFHAALKRYDLGCSPRNSLGSVGEQIKDSWVESDNAATNSSSGGDPGSTFCTLQSMDGLKSSSAPSTFRNGGPRRFPRTSFLVVSASWLESASELLDVFSADTGRVGVLNSASGTTPGGRFLKGTVSQEDCLCRASLLYSCISHPKFQFDGRFYGKNRSLRYGTSNCVIFSPGKLRKVVS